jgi:AmmeMemoRadiSam system protein A
MSDALSAGLRARLLQTAREAITAHVQGARWTLSPEGEAELLQARCAFVSLKHAGNGELRGCVGRTDPRGPLLIAVADAAVAAACADPRFPPVTPEELCSLRVQISVLGPLADVRPEEVEVGRHGLVVCHQGRTGLLLPQVAVQYGWDRETFLSWTCRKAGLTPESWREMGCRIQAFTAEVFDETDEAQPEAPASGGR